MVMGQAQHGGKYSPAAASHASAVTCANNCNCAVSMQYGGIQLQHIAQWTPAARRMPEPCGTSANRAVPENFHGVAVLDIVKDRV